MNKSLTKYVIEELKKVICFNDDDLKKKKIAIHVAEVLIKRDEEREE